MKYFAIGALVFIYNGKRWAGSRFLYAQVFAQGFDERGFPRAHITVKKKYLLDTGKQDELSGGITEFA